MSSGPPVSAGLPPAPAPSAWPDHPQAAPGPGFLRGRNAPGSEGRGRAWCSFGRRGAGLRVVNARGVCDLRPLVADPPFLTAPPPPPRGRPCLSPQTERVGACEAICGCPEPLPWKPPQQAPGTRSTHHVPPRDGTAKASLRSVRKWAIGHPGRFSALTALIPSVTLGWGAQMES